MTISCVEVVQHQSGISPLLQCIMPALELVFDLQHLQRLTDRLHVVHSILTSVCSCMMHETTTPWDEAGRVKPMLSGFKHSQKSHSSLLNSLWCCICPVFLVPDFGSMERGCSRVRLAALRAMHMKVHTCFNVRTLCSFPPASLGKRQAPIAQYDSQYVSEKEAQLSKSDSSTISEASTDSRQVSPTQYLVVCLVAYNHISNRGT